MINKLNRFQPPATCPSTITVSMAQSAVSAVSVLNPKPTTSKVDTLKPKHRSRLSPSSSQSSSR
jgi:hypothetical protein